MITKYNTYINESNQFLTDKNTIREWLYEMNIINYTINDDLTVDVDDDVDINNKNIIEIPIKFNRINGTFYCIDNNLVSLKGCPSYVKFNFVCTDNILTSLEFCPTFVGGYFNCSNNKLKTLEYCPTHINESFICSDNKLTSLKGCPTFVDGYFHCYNNFDTLTNINDLDSKILIENINSIEVKRNLFDKYFEYFGGISVISIYPFVTK